MTARGWRRLGLAPSALLASAVLGVGCSSESEPQATSSPGRQISAERGCAACHGENGEGGIGPTWEGLAGSEVELEDGTTVTADEEYLRTSITDPDAQTVAGYNVKMPPAVLSDEEIDEIVAYIQELR